MYSRSTNFLKHSTENTPCKHHNVTCQRLTDSKYNAKSIKITSELCQMPKLLVTLQQPFAKLTNWKCEVYGERDMPQLYYQYYGTGDRNPYGCIFEVQILDDQQIQLQLIRPVTQYGYNYDRKCRDYGYGNYYCEFFHKLVPESDSSVSVKFFAVFSKSNI